MKIWTTVLKCATALGSLLLCIHLFLPCLVGATEKPRDLPIGRWECQIEYGSWIIERNANGTFEKKGKLVQTLGHAPEEFLSKVDGASGATST